MTNTLTVPDYMLHDTVYLAEHHMYGSSRLGIKSYPENMLYNAYDATTTPTALHTGLSNKQPWYHWS